MTPKLHLEILKDLGKEARLPENNFDVAAYLGHDDFSYYVRTPVKRKIAKDFLKRHPDLSSGQFLELLNSLYSGKSHDEKSIAGLLLEYGSAKRASIKPQDINEWLSHLHGWGQIDSLCQSLWLGEELLPDFPKWEKFLIKLSKDKNINKRRASLVLLVKPVRYSMDQRLMILAFENISRLECEREILITKAVSWLLRSLTALHPKEVRVYLHEHASTLPKIAIRETIRKLNTGRK